MADFNIEKGLSKEEQAQKGQALIKQIYEDGVATIGKEGEQVDYQFTPMTHKKRRKVYAFFSKIQSMMKNGDFSFMDWPDFEVIEKIIFEQVLVNGDMQLSKSPNHFEEDKFASHYLKFISVALPVICFPFIRDDLGD